MASHPGKGMGMQRRRLEGSASNNPRATQPWPSLTQKNGVALVGDALSRPLAGRTGR